MKLTKNQVYVGMIAAAAAAWCVDRFVLGGGMTEPASATAAPLAPVAPPPLASVVPAAAPIPPHTAPSLAARFATVTADGTRDAFAPPPSWMPETEIAPTAASTQTASAPAAVSFDAAAFRHEHRLTAVLMRGRNSGVAIIDGKMVDVGGTFMGLKLRELTPTSATLTGAGGDVVLQSDVPTPRDAAGRPNLVKSPP